MQPKGVVFEGKTLDDAVRKGLEELGLPRAEVMITVLEEGSGGFLGIGARPYKVRMMPRPRREGAERSAPAGRARRGSRPGHEPRRDRASGSRREPRSGPESGPARGDRGDRRERRDRSGRPSREEARGRDGRGPASAAGPPRDPERPTEPGPGLARRRRGRRGGRPDRPREPREAEGVEVRTPPSQRSAVHRSSRPPRSVPASGVEGGAAPAEESGMGPEELSAQGRRLAEDLLQAMGFEATVSARAEGDSVEVTAEVPDEDDLLTGRKGEVRQALQHLLNRMLNRGRGSRYHLQLEINDFWRRREGELRDLALGLADQALEENTEKLTEYLNAQERRIVHVTLRDDARVKTYAIGDGLIKKVAVAPADFAQGPKADE